MPSWDCGTLRKLFEIEVFRFLRERELLSRKRMELILKTSLIKILRHIGSKHPGTAPLQYRPPPQPCGAALG